MEKHWTRWYSDARWKRMRAQQLQAEPLCKFCKLDGKLTPATVADHVERHFGDPNKFWTGKLQSVCRDCHEVRKKFIEARGYSRDVDPATGWPKDEKHPANLPRSAFKRFGFDIPPNLQRSGIPVTLVCGPPAAGKSTWINAHKRPGDTTISLDDCKQRVGGRPWDTERKVWRRAMAHRDAMLRALATQRQGRAFFEVAAPTQAEREAWREALGAARVVILATPAAVCIERVQADPARAHAMRDLILAVQRWHHWHARPERLNLAQRSVSNPTRPDAA